MAGIASQPVFQEEVGAHGDSTGHESLKKHMPYQVGEVPGKGIGLVSTRPIRAWTKIMDSTPAVMIDGHALDDLRVWEMTDLIRQAIDMLPPHHREQYMNLSAEHNIARRTDKVYKIFATNAFRTSIGDGGEDLHSVFTDVSRMNHDCESNGGYYFDHKTLAQKVYATRDIMPGEELSVGYIDPVQPRWARQAQLQKNWGFSCTCQRCSQEEHVVAESDARVQQIRSIWAELDDYSPSSAGSPDKAELLIELQELEGQHGRIHESFYRAALEWNGVGEPIKAIKYARLCLHRGLVVRGTGRPFQKSLQELLDNPQGHWSWRFRLKARGSESAADGSRS